MSIDVHSNYGNYNVERIKKVIEWYKLGADFADAMHLATCGEATLHTFDRAFCKTARQTNLTPKIQIIETQK